MSHLSGRTALVTGASRGLGRAIADELAVRGARVFGTARSLVEATEIAERYDTRPLVLDVTAAESVAPVVDELMSEVPVDLLVNNAGVNVPRNGTSYSRRTFGARSCYQLR